MTGFVQSLTAEPVQPSALGYAQISLSSNTNLAWPSFAAAGQTVVAELMDVTPATPGLTIRMPPANQVATGRGSIIRNLGGSSFILANASGSTIGTVNSGQVIYIYVTNNSTINGTWANIAFGTGASTADAASLQGAGIKAIGAALNQSFPPVLSNAVSVAVNNASRASLLVCTGGNATYTLNGASVLGADWFCGVSNAGTGTMTIACSGVDTIDGAVNIQLAPTESTLIVCSGTTTFYTVGRGRNTSFQFTQLVKNIAPGGTTTLTSGEVGNRLIRFTGVLTSTATVVFPSIIAVYFVANDTTGAFLTNLQTSGGTPYNIPQGQRAIVYCDGTNILAAQTAVPSGAVSFADGSVSAPGISFSAEPGLGLYRPGPGVVSVAGQNNDVLRLTSVASGANRLEISNAPAGSPASIGTGSGNLALSATGGEVIVDSAVRLGSVISPAALTVNVDNWNPAGFGSARTIRVSSTGPVNITGLLAGLAGRQIVLTNVGTFNITLLNQSASSAAANRFNAVTDVLLLAGQSLVLEYDAIAARWTFPARTSSSPFMQTLLSDSTSAAIATDTLLAGTGRRIVSDFGNATPSLRTIFQPSNLNSFSVITNMPSGSAAEAGFMAVNNSTMVNFSFAYLYSNNLETGITSSRLGSAPFLNFALYTSTIRRFTIDTDGNIVIGDSGPLAGTRQLSVTNVNTSSLAAARLQVTADSGITQLDTTSIAGGGVGVLNTSATNGLSIRTGSVDRLRVRPDNSFWTDNNTQPMFFCRGWVNFNGATGAPRGTRNVSSVTRNNPGDYTVSFTTALPDTNYVTVVTGEINSGANASINQGLFPGGIYSTTQVQVFSHLALTGGFDRNIICVAIFR